MSMRMHGTPQGGPQASQAWVERARMVRRVQDTVEWLEATGRMKDAAAVAGFRDVPHFARAAREGTLRRGPLRDLVAWLEQLAREEPVYGGRPG